MLLGRGVACVKGFRFVAGIDIFDWRDYMKGKDLDTLKESLLQMSDAIVNLTPDEFAKHGGFTICIKPGQILLTPPGTILVEVPLSASTYAVQWHYLASSQVASTQILQDQIRYVNQIASFDLKEADDSDSSLAQLQFLERIVEQMELAESLTEWISQRSNFSPEALLGFGDINFDEYQENIDNMALEAVDKQEKFGKRVKKIHSALVKLEEGSKEKNVAHSNRAIPWAEVKEFNSIDGHDLEKLFCILWPAIEFTYVDRIDETECHPSVIKTTDACDILKAFLDRCSGKKAVATAATALATTHEAEATANQKSASAKAVAAAAAGQEKVKENGKDEVEAEQIVMPPQAMTTAATTAAADLSHGNGHEESEEEEEEKQIQEKDGSGPGTADNLNLRQALTLAIANYPHNDDQQSADGEDDAALEQAQQQAVVLVEPEQRPSLPAATAGAATAAASETTSPQRTSKPDFSDEAFGNRLWEGLKRSPSPASSDYEEAPARAAAALPKPPAAAAAEAEAAEAEESEKKQPAAPAAEKEAAAAASAAAVAKPNPPPPVSESKPPEPEPPVAPLPPSPSQAEAEAPPNPTDPAAAAAATPAPTAAALPAAESGESSEAKLSSGGGGGGGSDSIEAAKAEAGSAAAAAPTEPPNNHSFQPESKSEQSKTKPQPKQPEPQPAAAPADTPPAPPNKGNAVDPSQQLREIRRSMSLTKPAALATAAKPSDSAAANVKVEPPKIQPLTPAERKSGQPSPSLAETTVRQMLERSKRKRSSGSSVDDAASAAKAATNALRQPRSKAEWVQKATDQGIEVQKNWTIAQIKSRLGLDDNDGKSNKDDANADAKGKGNKTKKK